MLLEPLTQYRVAEKLQEQEIKVFSQQYLFEITLGWLIVLTENQSPDYILDVPFNLLTLKREQSLEIKRKTAHVTQTLL